MELSERIQSNRNKSLVLRDSLGFDALATKTNSYLVDSDVPPQHQQQPQQSQQATYSLQPIVFPTTRSLQSKFALLSKQQQSTELASNNANLSMEVETTTTTTKNPISNINSSDAGTVCGFNSPLTSTITQTTAVFDDSLASHHLLQRHQHMQTYLPHHHSHGTMSGTSVQLKDVVSGDDQQLQQQPIEKLSRPMVFDKMEELVREMQDQDHGVPELGYDLIEWLMDRLHIEESEALNIANQLCLHGYFFPVNDCKTLAVKDDSSLYRFQTPYYWPWQHKSPDNVEYAIYLVKRSLRNKQRHALEDYEIESLTSLNKNLKGKWDFISMQAEEQVRLAKERKKGDKIVADSQERAYWRVHRPLPGQFTPLEPCPTPSRDRQGPKPKKITSDDMQREMIFLTQSLNRTRMKMSQACESLVCYSETFIEYDFFLQAALPSNPWVTEDITFWLLNNAFVEIPTEKRVKRWAISIEELVSDPTGLQEFTYFLEKEYSHENIRFWISVSRLRRAAHSQVSKKVTEIYEEFLKPGAPCEINIDSKTMESVLQGLKTPSRFTYDSASDHIYMLLLKKDCYPRFIRSDHYKRLLENGIQPLHKKRFFNFGGVSGTKKKITAALNSQTNIGDGSKVSSNSSAIGILNCGSSIRNTAQAPLPENLSRQESDRSLTGSAHELRVIGLPKNVDSTVPHSHSQSNIGDMHSNSSDCGELVDCIQRDFGIQHQNFVDSSEGRVNRRIPNIMGQRRASMSTTHIRDSDYQQCGTAISTETCIGTESSSIITSTAPISIVDSHSIPLSTNVKVNIVTELLDTRCGTDTNQLSSNTELITIPTPTQMHSTVAEPTQLPGSVDSSRVLAPSASPFPLKPANTDSRLPVELKFEQTAKNSLSDYDLSEGIAETPSLSIVKEVQIELIENSNCTPTAKVQEPAMSINDGIISPTSESSSKLCTEKATVSLPFIEAIKKNPSTLLHDERNVEGIKLYFTDVVKENETKLTKLSPTSNKKKMHFNPDGQYISYDDELADTDRYLDYIPPAPTPAPSMAPLAELEVDIIDDESSEAVSMQVIGISRTLTSGDVAQNSTDDKKCRSSLDEKVQPKTPATSSSEFEHDVVCPWEDDNVSTNEDTFVKTYATLGYL